jgi:hypothetical protein
MPRSAHPEDDIQRTVLALFALRAAPGTFVFHVSNGRARRPIESAILKSLGLRAGIPDLLVIRESHVFALQLKPLDGRLSPAQLAAHDALRGAGAEVAVAGGIDQLIAVLERWGLLRGQASISR